MSTGVYTKVLSVGKHERYWGGWKRIQTLCEPYRPTHIWFPGWHAQEDRYEGVVGKAMAELLA